jgi:magnesium-transporting ATPase (P-type)
MNESIYPYYYLIGTLWLGLLWGIIFFSRKDLRKQMMTVSLFISLFGITEHFWYYGKYWQPEWILKVPYLNTGFEDYLLCFFYGGIAAALYEFVTRRHLVKDSRKKPSLTAFIIAILTGFSVVAIIEYYTSWNIIISTGTAIFTSGLVVIAYRRDLLKPAFQNFLLMILVTIYWQAPLRLLFPDMYERFWILEQTSQKMLFGVLYEEYFFHVCLAFGIGPLYEMTFGYVDRKMRRKPA